MSSESKLKTVRESGLGQCVRTALDGFSLLPLSKYSSSVLHDDSTSAPNSELKPRVNVKVTFSECSYGHTYDLTASLGGR